MNDKTAVAPVMPDRPSVPTHDHRTEGPRARRQPLLVRPGFWCEVIRHLQPDDLDCGPVLVGSSTADNPGQAVRWLRIALRTVTAVLPPDNSAEVDAWLLGGHRRALRRLTAGTGCQLTATFQGAPVRWTARPVGFVPLADREARPLPACAEGFQPIPTSKGGPR